MTISSGVLFRFDQNDPCIIVPNNTGSFVTGGFVTISDSGDSADFGDSGDSGDSESPEKDETSENGAGSTSLLALLFLIILLYFTTQRHGWQHPEPRQPFS